MAKVTEDKEAFDHIFGRLTGDVGGVIRLVDEGQIHVPFWLLVRCIFPVAEAVADLIYHSTEPKSTAERLRLLLENEFESVRAGYKPVASTLTLLYRHSLTHQDVPRIVKSGGRHVGWWLGHRGGRHLKVTDNSGGTFTVELDPGALYDDLVKLVTAAGLQTWGGKVRDRYNSWFELDLDATTAKLSKVEKLAVSEIAAF